MKRSPGRIAWSEEEKIFLLSLTCAYKDIYPTWCKQAELNGWPLRTSSSVECKLSALKNNKNKGTSKEEHPFRHVRTVSSIAAIENAIAKIVSEQKYICREDIIDSLIDQAPKKQILVILDRMVQRGTLGFEVKDDAYFQI